MRCISLLATTLAALAAADSSTTTTIDYLVPDWDIEVPAYTSVAGSVAGINAVATTYEIKCLSGADKDACKIKTPWTLIQGPNTFSFTGVYTAWSTGANAVSVTRDIKCSYTSTESASCSMSYKATGTVNGVSSSTSTSSSAQSISATKYGMPITGGLKSFTAPQATQTPNAAPAAKPLITGAPLALAVAALL
ncbi:uncharacterized protein N7459_007183 [Penicillium hispanicum]|uniref:uncharacterized protein n=1 Tax=Penicillium hispanicum TaxID=1080232 RepID=UPI0025407F49|nr:uncharacterized protein N7459_007183 [Penicillium hispanicum]KAJ5578219.1 hypothetical protein N7459_007183 [Penicillium hispanicum]